MKAGFARLDITPPLGARLSGYFEERQADGILDPLQAHAVAFCDGKRKAVLVSLDIIGIRQKEMDEIRRLAARQNKIPYEAVFIACTHTHTAPEVNEGRLFEIDPSYNDYLFHRIADAVSLALADLKEASVEIGRGKAKDISFIRRYRMKDGSVRTNPGNDPEVEGPIGTPDETVQLVKIVRKDAADIAIVNFQVHPDTIGGSKISADYPGFVRRILENALQGEKDGRGVHVVYFNGAQGDTNHINRFVQKKPGTGHAEHMGRVIAGAALAAYTYTKPVDCQTVSYGQKVVEVASNRGTPEQVAQAKELVAFHQRDGVGFRKIYQGMMAETVLGEANTWIKHENGPDFFGLYLTGIRIGEVVFLGLPGEPFTDIGRKIKEQAPYEMVVPCCCANGYQGYYPTDNAYDEGGYEARSSTFKKGVAAALINKSVQLAEEMKESLYRKTPIMGWSSWNAYRVDIHEEKLKEQARLLVETGLAEYGYNYFNVDDGFFGGRDTDGTLLYHPERFPNGIRCISDYAHSLGLKAGIYSEGGRNTCAHYWDNEGANGVDVGLYGYEEQDLRRFLIEENFDFIKVDWCGGQKMGLEEETQYTKISKIIDQIRKETGRQLVFNVCRWQFPGEWVVDVADSWRTGGDIRPTFESVIYQIDKIKPLRKYCGPGHVNDLDMMQVGNGLTVEEEKTHFAMWCMMSTPLMVGCDLTKISAETLQILKNKELIALNQDEACLQAYVVKELRRKEDGSCASFDLIPGGKVTAAAGYEEEGVLEGEVWVKDLGQLNSNKKAVAFLNRSNAPLVMKATAEEIGLSGKVLSVRDLCEHIDLNPASVWEVTVPAHGVVVLRVSAEAAIEREFAEPDVMEVEKYVPITEEEKSRLLAESALLIDVRSADEYAKGHLEGAINIPFTSKEEEVKELLPDPARPLILYCSTGKRSAQAKNLLEYLGYEKVAYLGGVTV